MIEKVFCQSNVSHCIRFEGQNQSDLVVVFFSDFLYRCQKARIHNVVPIAV